MRSSRRLFSALVPSQNDGEQSGLAKVCQPCKVKLTHATCSGCRRHRKRWNTSSDGKPMCKACAEPEPDNHACPGCGLQVRGAGASRCFSCVRRDSAARRSRLLAVSLEEDWCRALWADFTSSLIGDEKRLNTVRARVDASIEYFVLIEAAFDSPEAVTSAALHHAIDSPMHRTHLLAYRFLVNKFGLEATADERDVSNEARRLADILDRAAGSPSADLLNGYVAKLQVMGLAPRTVRMYAGVAEKFCERVGATAGRCWSVGAIESFLKHTPGAANSLSKFVNHCRRQHGWDVRMPSKSILKNSPRAARQAVDRMRRALSGVDGRPADELKLLEVSRVIAAATGLTLRHLVAAQNVELPGSDAEPIKLGDDAVIEPGHPLHPFARRWKALIAIRAVRAGRLHVASRLVT